MAIKVNEYASRGYTWQNVKLHLQDKGFEVYSPNQKEGECERAYIVVKGDGSTPHANFSTDIYMYSLLCYVPEKKYSELEPYIRSVKKAMQDLEPMLKCVGTQSPSYFDEAVKAHTVSIDYTNYKKR